MLKPEDERQIKEILYLLMEKIRATKAALYLVDAGGAFRLAVQYGFSRADRIPEKVVRNVDPLANHVFERREPHYVNDIRIAGKLAPMMEATSSTRLLIAPLYLDGRIIGIIDARDKANREPFVEDDVHWANEVLRRLAVKARMLPQFAGPPAETEPEFETFATVKGSGPSPERGVPTVLEEPVRAQTGNLEPPSYLPSGTARALRFVEETLQVAPVGPAVAAGPSSRETGLYRLVLETCLTMPAVELALLSLFEPDELSVGAMTRRPLGPDMEPAVAANLEKVFARAGVAFDFPAVRNLQLQPVRRPEAPSLAHAEIAATHSSILAVQPDSVLTLSLFLSEPLSPDGEERVNALHALFRSAVGDLRAAAAYRDAYRGLVSRLLEPGIKKLSALRTHSFNVGRLARRFASFLALPPRDVEQITTAAILHDVGMRDLNYDEVYAKRSLNEEELRLVREHPRVGAHLLEGIAWPYPVAPLVRHHHERWDGAGYPDGLAGEQIPYGARVIHLCEAFDAMTSPASYRSVLAVPQALEILVSKGGTQFDPELAPAFKRMIDSVKATP